MVLFQLSTCVLKDVQKLKNRFSRESHKHYALVLLLRDVCVIEVGVRRRRRETCRKVRYIMHDGMSNEIFCKFYVLKEKQKKKILIEIFGYKNGHFCDKQHDIIRKVNKKKCSHVPRIYQGSFLRQRSQFTASLISFVGCIKWAIIVNEITVKSKTNAFSDRPRLISAEILGGFKWSSWIFIATSQCQASKVQP